MQEQKIKEPININISDGDAFFAHEVTMNFTPTQFTFDFKCITPRNDPRSKTTSSFCLKHNVVMVDPWHAKALQQVISSVIKRYEDEYGKIEKPKALTKAEKKQKSIMEEVSKKEDSAPTYLG